MKDDELLDNFTSAMSSALLDVSEEPGWYVWPMPIFHPTEGNFYLYAPRQSLVVDLFRTIKRLESEGLRDIEIARLFKKPSRIASLTYTFEGLRRSNLTKEEQVDFAVKLLKYIGHLREDPFCKNKKNILWKSWEVDDAMKKSPIINLERSETETNRIRETFGKINAGLFLLCEFLYFAHHSIGHEFHGPYQLGDGKTLIVREYYDLKSEIWNFMENFPFEGVTSIEIYKNVKIQFDFFNRVRSTEQISPALAGVCLREGGLDGKIVDTGKKMKELLDTLLSIARTAQKTVTKMKKTELLKKYVETHYYIQKPLVQRLREDWHPPPEVYEFVEKNPPPKELMEAFRKMADLPMEQQIAGCKLIFDPRVERLPF